ncbi:MAG TPA: hypothetical protein VLW75_04085 [Rhizomicrobium sp.]|nr:hypothetical protein [Rhizomicrobium sp.]
MSEAAPAKSNRSKAVFVGLAICTILYMAAFRYITVSSISRLMPVASHSYPQHLSHLQMTLASIAGAMAMIAPSCFLMAAIGGWVLYYFRRMRALYILLAIPPILALIWYVSLARLIVSF